MKKMLSALAALVLALGGALVVASAASAHTAVVTGVAECQEDGTYTVAWTVTLAEYGDHQEIDLKVIGHAPSGSLINGVDGQVWLYEWTDHAANHGLPPFPPDGVATFEQTMIPGTATSASVVVQFDWKDGPSGDPEGHVILPGDCEPTDEPPVERPPIEQPPAEQPPTEEEPPAEEEPQEGEQRLPDTGVSERLAVFFGSGVIAAGAGLALTLWQRRNNGVER